MMLSVFDYEEITFEPIKISEILGEEYEGIVDNDERVIVSIYGRVNRDEINNPYGMIGGGMKRAGSRNKIVNTAGLSRNMSLE